ncbi:DUF3761 domain-containing protein [Acetobacteroides hydrogenigenes]|uniref:SH3 domain-containing protein n=1 Tax=Acetobacteroides hydrogenigenes TaxID=979970 RepID=A0A4R2E5H0_9BACT|nr:DUF3761 domain-containing protein [Acetobacteroides hydrogenigenes]TCN62737.1 SH3 domain-containing protein [Acetobacteroides hydrogenigenes]
MKRFILLLGLLFLTICSFGQIMVTTGNVNFRTTPGVSENKICIIPKGITVTIVQDSIESENWTKISYNGNTGYVSNSFLKSISTSSKRYNYSNTYGSTEVKYYKNSKGNKVQSPTYYNTVPAGATAVCNDGTYSFSNSRRGTCSHHGGVRKWL